MRDRHSGFRTDPEALLRPGEAAKLLGFTPRALEAWRQRGSGPPFVRVSSRAIRYRRADLAAWAEGRVYQSTSQAMQEERAVDGGKR